MNQTDPTARDRLFALIASIPGSSSVDWCDEVRALLDEAAAVSAVVSPPTSRAALRDRIAQALDNANRTHPCPVTGSQYWTGCYHPDGTSSSCHTNRRTDAVLSVLPVQDDRAAVLLWAADHLLTLKTPPNYTGVHGLMFSNGAQAAGEELRRLAAEAQDAVTAEHHTVDGARYLCHTDDHYCPSEARPAEAQQPETGAPADTLPAWLLQRFDPRSPDWEQLGDDDRAYWEHQARAVRRAVARGGFKPQADAPAPVAQQPAADGEETRRG
ncbi:hypothetical protein [Streptomyces griseofuscus]|uniref:hypothetical protein n=1 Tax=Streptomyces griseofuscus TaxID=146922 RepID=UPI0033BFE295